MGFRSSKKVPTCCCFWCCVFLATSLQSSFQDDYFLLLLFPTPPLPQPFVILHHLMVLSVCHLMFHWLVPTVCRVPLFISVIVDVLMAVLFISCLIHLMHRFQIHLGVHSVHHRLVSFLTTSRFILRRSFDVPIRCENVSSCTCCFRLHRTVLHDISCSKTA